MALSNTLYLAHCATSIQVLASLMLLRTKIEFERAILRALAASFVLLPLPSQQIHAQAFMGENVASLVLYGELVAFDACRQTEAWELSHFWSGRSLLFGPHRTSPSAFTCISRPPRDSNRERICLLRYQDITDRSGFDIGCSRPGGKNNQLGYNRCQLDSIRTLTL